MEPHIVIFVNPKIFNQPDKISRSIISLWENKIVVVYKITILIPSLLGFCMYNLFCCTYSFYKIVYCWIFHNANFLFYDETGYNWSWFGEFLHWVYENKKDINSCEFKNLSMYFDYVYYQLWC